jgi:hypothetical protein
VECAVGGPDDLSYRPSAFCSSHSFKEPVRVSGSSTSGLVGRLVRRPEFVCRQRASFFLSHCWFAHVRLRFHVQFVVVVMASTMHFSFHLQRETAMQRATEFPTYLHINAECCMLQHVLLMKSTEGLCCAFATPKETARSVYIGYTFFLSLSSFLFFARQLCTHIYLAGCCCCF